MNAILAVIIALISSPLSAALVTVLLNRRRNIRIFDLMKLTLNISFKLDSITIGRYNRESFETIYTALYDYAFKANNILMTKISYISFITDISKLYSRLDIVDDSNLSDCFHELFIAAFALKEQENFSIAFNALINLLLLLVHTIRHSQ